MEIKNFEDALSYIGSLKGIHKGLDHIEELLRVLGNPEEGLKVISVVGTNGKGSTALFIAEILKASGLKVGLFSSPKVFAETEIIKVNSRNISKKDYTRLAKILSETNTVKATSFECETAMAFLYFKEKGCDIAVLEAGMGGLLDATNVVKSNLLSVFTPIGLDHTEYLGSTLTEIADNKTGVIKPNSIAVTTLQEPEAMEVIQSKACRLHSDCVVSDYKGAQKIKYKLGSTKFDYEGMKSLEISINGVNQIQNACLAIDAVKALKKYGIDVTEKAIGKGLLSAREEGRFEIISNKPVIVLDGAHNPPAARMLRENLNTYFTDRKFIYIMGMFKDKDADKVIETICDLPAAIFTVTLPNKERSLTAFELAKKVSHVNRAVSTADSVHEALELALQFADKDTVIVGFGSLSHLKLIKDAYESIVRLRR